MLADRARAWMATLVALPVALSAGAARADLAEDAGRLARFWTLHGAQVERLPAVFVDHGRPVALALGGPADAASSGCLTVAFVSVRTAEFTLAQEPLPLGGAAGPLDPMASRAAAPPGASHAAPHPTLLPPEGAEPKNRSAGGASSLTRCGSEREALGRVTLEMVSPRGAVEVLAARSQSRLPDLREVLPERAAGPLAPRGDAGGAIEPGPLAGRLSRAERRARDEGAAHVVRAEMSASPGGAGRFSARMSEGCHRVEVMAEIPATLPRRPTDLDAEAREAGGRLLARDRADVPDARLDFCLGEATVVDVGFVGASGAVLVTLSDAHWPLPLEVPAQWGARARAGLSWALFRRHAPAPADAPVFEALGVQGGTRVPVEIEPGRCYLVAAALVRGDARLVRLSAEIGGGSLHDDGLEPLDSASLAFCAGTSSVAKLGVEARGNGLWWALAVWPMGSTPP